MFKNVLSSISFYVNVRRILLYVKIEIIIFKNVQVQNITKNWFTHKHRLILLFYYLYYQTFDVIALW